ncbi:BnaC03g76580D [Brassica napus]|uniref:BnaC03g76580D protein n=1 Tax=Brassica napus TaxID=3708 RepID=A0A078JFS8_BRANA|nr:BnaC03g76580D [Brassica napus]
MFVDGPSSTTRSQSEHQRLKTLRKMKVSNWVLRLSFQDREPEER